MSLLTRFSVSTAPTEMLSDSPKGVMPSTLLELTMRASIFAVDFDVTSMSRPAWMFRFRVCATVSSGCSSPNTLPARASMVLARMFCGAQPTVLKARVAPMA